MLLLKIQMNMISRGALCIEWPRCSIDLHLCWPLSIWLQAKFIYSKSHISNRNSEAIRWFRTTDHFCTCGLLFTLDKFSAVVSRFVGRFIQLVIIYSFISRHWQARLIARKCNQKRKMQLVKLARRKIVFQLNSQLKKKNCSK